MSVQSIMMSTRISTRAFLAFTLSGLLMPQAESVAQSNLAQPSTPRAMQIGDLFRYDRLADPRLSPDGRSLVYQATRFSDPAKNAKATQLWFAPSEGGEARQLTYSGKSDTHPRWSPDGSQILFESNRDGTSQLYILDLAKGGEPRRVTSIATGANNGTWSPDGKRIAFVSTVNPAFSELPFEESDAKNREQADAAESNPVKAKTFTRLFYRHWDSYVEDKRQHIFVIDADGKNCRDVTPGDRDAYPTSTTFSANEDFCFTPDGKALIVTAVPEKGEAWTTNYDLCRIEIDKPSTQWKSLTAGNPAADGSPKFSPSGKRFAYRAQAKPGYEADKWNLLVVDCDADGSWSGKPATLTEGLDRSLGDFVWIDDNNLAFTTEEQGASAVYKVAIGGKPTKAPIDFGDGRFGQLTAIHNHNNTLAVARATMNRPAEIFTISMTSSPTTKQVTHQNDALAKEIFEVRPESIQVPVEGSTSMQMWILKPPAFDPSKKWPVAYLIHGGPQGAWEDGWSFRWNPQLWAAQGYVVVLPNPRGSTGFGQAFCDEISGDWGGKCYRDLVAGLAAIKKLPYVDSQRIGSAGASFGGYMQDWFAVNDIAKDLRCLISHCSVYNFESMWGTTEELWFDEYEHGGLPWEIPGKYREFSPHTLAGNLGKHKTPMLVIHNDLDFRCPIGQGHELFQALQRQGVPSRFVNFPDEGHWVSKSHNSIHWHSEVFAWMTKYCPPGGK
jgi:dipeptidyl aminopeptidase/acylaminoacyl peptidase